MYNPDALTQAIQTGVTAEKALLDSLRGPDAAHRVTDDQIRNIITLPAFKPRHGRLKPETAYVDDDVNRRISFYPYDYETITVGIACERYFKTSDEWGQTFLQAWFTISDGDHFSSRPLTEEAFISALAVDSLPYDHEKGFYQGSWYDWHIDKCCVNYALQNNYINTDDLFITTNGQFVTRTPTLEQANRVLKNSYNYNVSSHEWHMPPFSTTEFEARMNGINGQSGDIVKAYDHARCIFPDGRNYREAASGLRAIMKIEPKESVLLTEANKLLDEAVSAKAKCILNEQEKCNEFHRERLANKTYHAHILEEAKQKVLEWSDARDEQLRKLKGGGNTLATNIAVIGTGKDDGAFTALGYESTAGRLDDEFDAGSFAYEWCTSDQALKEGAGLYDEDNKPRFLNVTTYAMCTSVCANMGRYFDATALPAEPESLTNWEHEPSEFDNSMGIRQMAARTVIKVSEAHPANGGKREALAGRERELLVGKLLSPSVSFTYLFEEIISWIRDLVEPGYPVIFKGRVEREIDMSRVSYIQRPNDEGIVFDFREEYLPRSRSSIFTHMGEKEAVKVTFDSGLGCIALSVDRCVRGDDGEWEPRGVIAKNKEQVFDLFVGDVRSSKEPVQYFVAGSDNRTRKSLVDGRELLATSLTPADILYIARQRGVNMPAMVVEKALPGQRGLLVRTGIDME